MYERARCSGLLLMCSSRRDRIVLPSQPQVAFSSRLAPTTSTMSASAAVSVRRADSCPAVPNTPRYSG